MQILSEKPRSLSAENARTISVDYHKADNSADKTEKEEELKLDLEDFNVRKKIKNNCSVFFMYKFVFVLGEQVGQV